MQIKNLTTPFSYVTTDVMPWCSSTGVDSKVSYGDLRTAISNYAASQNPVTNNARLFDCSYRLNGDYAPGDIIAGATTLTGTGGGALFAGQVVLRFHTDNQKYNGLYLVQSGGAAAIRYSKANTGGLLMYSVAMPNAGTYKGKWYKCTNLAAVIDVDPVNYTEVFTPQQGLETTDSPTFAGLTISADPLSAKTAKFGDGGTTNYSEFEANGTLKFNGDATCYLDAVVPFCYKGGTGEANFDTFVGGIKNLKFLVGDFVAFQNTEAPHDYKEGSEIEIHLHWAINQAMIAGDKVKWNLELAFANPINGVNTGTIFCDPATPTVFGTKTIEIEYTSPVGGAPAGSYIYSTFGTVSATDMANVKIGAGFIGVLTRVAKSAGGTDPATGCVYGLNLGIHYEVDTIGSRQRGTK